MLTAGVLGTVLGDDCSHLIGQGAASLGLGAILCLVLTVGRGASASFGAYWAIVAVARTAGTAVGDWLAESRILNMGLTLSNLISGAAFVAVLVAWRGRGAAVSVTNGPNRRLDDPAGL